ncbi:MAG: isoaspartyl peptidase/L-asparaginase [Saprospiraceae bacterium]|nr:isoaspartyl peptidase/L-asparaginase [Saprospiraceae bacterium]MDW8229140.1 isoaspartyl peptidase/L-asparaginase [Saprospiraceae bacterium]
MLRVLFGLAMASFMAHCTSDKTAEKQGDKARPDYIIVIHGGAGTLSRQAMTADKEARYRAALDSALQIGESILRSGGTALDAVTETVAWLEDCPLFNAGRGAVFTHEGRNELDASIMDGRTHSAGAVGGVTIVKNPIRLARAVMEKSPHVFLVGPGAERFAIENGLDTVSPSWFFTQERWDALQKVLQKSDKTGDVSSDLADYKFGTVGAVALDRQGNLAAATSTGGMTNKRWNRLGDSPVIGAGTYASNDACAVSCTGHGEYFIRYAVAHDVWARMVYGGASLQEAAHAVIMKKLVEKGGEGGLIAVDKSGAIAMPFNTEGMYRGYARPGERKTAIFADE